MSLCVCVYIFTYMFSRTPQDLHVQWFPCPERQYRDRKEQRERERQRANTERNRERERESVKLAALSLKPRQKKLSSRGHGTPSLDSFWKYVCLGAVQQKCIILEKILQFGGIVPGPTSQQVYSTKTIETEP